MEKTVEGGGEIIEIDESIFGKKRKYNRGSIHSRKWVFGIAQRGTRKTYFTPVTDRSKETLTKIIVERVEKEAVIYHDDWAAYRDLDELGYQHGIVVHTREFVSAKGVCTNTIEGKCYVT